MVVWESRSEWSGKTEKEEYSKKERKAELLREEE